MKKLADPKYLKPNSEVLETAFGADEDREWHSLDPHGRFVITNFEQAELDSYSEAIELFEKQYPQFEGTLSLVPEAYDCYIRPVRYLNALVFTPAKEYAAQYGKPFPKELYTELKPFEDIRKLVALKAEHLAVTETPSRHARIYSALIRKGGGFIAELHKDDSANDALFSAAVKAMVDLQLTFKQIAGFGYDEDLNALVLEEMQRQNIAEPVL